MGNTPAGRGNDFPTILGIFKIYPKSRSETTLSSGWILTQTVKKAILYSPKLRPAKHVGLGWVCCVLVTLRTALFLIGWMI